MTKTMTHTVSRVMNDIHSDNNQTETITVRILKNYIEDSCGNKFTVRNGFNLKYSPRVSDRIDLATLAPITAE